MVVQSIMRMKLLIFATSCLMPIWSIFVKEIPEDIPEVIVRNSRDFPVQGERLINDLKLL